MQKKNQTERKLKNLERQIRRVARQVARCWDLLQQSPCYIAPPMELVIKVSKM